MSFPNPDNYARDCDCGTAGVNTAPPPAIFQAEIDSLDTRITAHEADTTNVHGIANTANLAFSAVVVGIAPINWSAGSHFAGTLSANTSINFQNVVAGKSITVAITGYLGYGVNWPGVTWISGSAPAITDGQTTYFRILATSVSTFIGEGFNGKIGFTSNLPLITTTNGAITTGSFGTTANSFCQGNDTRLDRSTFIATWLSGGTPGYRNMADNTLELINFNTTDLNTDNTNYSLELGHNNNAIDGKIRIGKTGTYLVNLIYNTYDISPGAYYSFYIFTNGTSKSTASSHLVTLFDQAPAGGSVATGARYLFGGMTGIVVVLNAPLWVSLVFRPTAGNPYPTDGTSGSYTQPPRVEIIKVT